MNEQPTGTVPDNIIPKDQLSSIEEIMYSTLGTSLFNKVFGRRPSNRREKRLAKKAGKMLYLAGSDKSKEIEIINKIQQWMKKK